MTITRSRRSCPSRGRVAIGCAALASALVLGACGSSAAGPLDPVATSSSARPHAALHAFCRDFGKDASVLKNADGDAQAAADALDELAADAPKDVRPDVRYVDRALHAALQGHSGNVTKIRNATTRLTEFAVRHCRGITSGT